MGARRAPTHILTIGNWGAYSGST